MKKALKIYTADEITAFIEADNRQFDPVTKPERRARPAIPLSDLPPADDTPVKERPNPYSATMQGYAYIIPLHRVDAEELERRIQSEVERIDAVRGRGGQREVGDWIDATPERLGHIADRGLDAGTVNLLTPSGFPTGVKFRKIDTPIEQAMRRKWIRERHYMAGTRFLHYLYNAKLEPRLVANLEKAVDGSRSNSVSDYRLHCQEQVNRALRATDARYRDPFFTWAYACLSQDVSVGDLGTMFSKAKHLPSQLRMGKKVLWNVLEDFAKHWGL